MPFLGFIAVIVMVPLMITSCASLAPESPLVIPKTSQLQHLHKVALSASVSELKVRYARDEASILPACLGLAGPFIGLLPYVAGEFIDYGVRSSQDTMIKGQFQDTIQGWSISERLSRHTIEEINKGSVFHLDAAQGRQPSQFISDGYDGLIDIALDEIYFQRDGTSDKLHIFLRGTGKMIELATGSVVWKREELTATHLSHSIAEYTAGRGHLLKEEIDNLLHELSFRLASDLVYAQ